MFLMKFNSSCVNICNFKCGTCVFKEPNDGCLCSWNFTDFRFVPLLMVNLNCLSSFFQSSGKDVQVSLCCFGRMVCDRIYFSFHLRQGNNVLFFKNVAVNLYWVKVVARAFEKNVTTIFDNSSSFVSDSHWVAWFMAYLYSVFCSFSSQS